MKCGEQFSVGEWINVLACHDNVTIASPSTPWIGAAIYHGSHYTCNEITRSWANLQNVNLCFQAGWLAKTFKQDDWQKVDDTWRQLTPESDYNQQKCPDLFPPNFVIIIPTDVKSITVAIE